jgi:WD40 repeat protein
MNYFKVNLQRHFLYHTKEVCSIAVSSQGLVASGERGSTPCIMVWSIKDLVPRCIFSGQHNADVYLLRFLGEENYLASVCKRLNPGVLIHNIETNELLFSCCLEEFIRGIDILDFQTAEIIEEQKFSNNRMNIVMFSQHCIYFFYHKNLNGMYSILQHDKQNNLFGESLSEITSIKTALLSTSGSHLRSLSAGWQISILTGHSDGKVCIWNVDSNHEKIIPSKILCFYNSSVSNIVITSLGFTVCTEDLGLHIWDLDFTSNIKELDLNTFGLRIDSKLKNVVCKDDLLFFLTLESEMFSFELKLSPMWSKNMFVHKYEVKAVNTVFALGEDMTSAKFIERVRICL